MQKGDDAGHIIGKLLGGRGDVVDNLFAQNAHINRGAYRVFERRIADAAIAGSTLKLKVTLKYAGKTKRVTGVIYEVWENGVPWVPKQTFGN
jgi:hypothetical protein